MGCYRLLENQGIWGFFDKAGTEYFESFMLRKEDSEGYMSYSRIFSYSPLKPIGDARPD
jgi:hypothetical protein